MSKSNQTLYRDHEGNPISAEQVQQIRSDPDALDKKFYFRPIRPKPTEPHVIGTIGGVPVIQVTDRGESIHSDVLREVAFMVPGNRRVHEHLLEEWNEVPRHLSRFGAYVVLNVTDETWKSMDNPAAN